MLQCDGAFVSCVYIYPSLSKSSHLILRGLSENTSNSYWLVLIDAFSVSTYTPSSSSSLVVCFYISIIIVLVWAYSLTASVVRVPGYRSRGTGLDSRRYWIFWEVVGLERGPLCLVSITEELLEWKSNGSGSRKPRLTVVGIRCADHATPSIRNSWH
jgi:hypothetical protein